MKDRCEVWFAWLVSQDIPQDAARLVLLAGGPLRQGRREMWGWGVETHGWDLRRRGNQPLAAWEVGKSFASLKTVFFPPKWPPVETWGHDFVGFAKQNPPIVTMHPYLKYYEINLGKLPHNWHPTVACIVHSLILSREGLPLLFGQCPNRRTDFWNGASPGTFEPRFAHNTVCKWSLF